MMEEKVKKLLGALSYSELISLKRDVDSGSFLLQHMLNSKLNELEHSHRKFCANCNKQVSTEIDDVYTLVFGDKTIKKKATFCGTDCLNSFIQFLQDEKLNTLRKTSLDSNLLDSDNFADTAFSDYSFGDSNFSDNNFSDSTQNNTFKR